MAVPGIGALYLLFSAILPMSGAGAQRFTLWLADLAMFAFPLRLSAIMTTRYVRRL